MRKTQANRPTWLAIVILGAALAAVIVAGLFYANAASVLVAMSAAGAAFLAVLGVGLKMFEFLAP